MNRIGKISHSHSEEIFFLGQETMTLATELTVEAFTWLVKLSATVQSGNKLE
jgi:hypothetical protein